MHITYKLVGIQGDYTFTKEHSDVEFMTLTNFHDDIIELGFEEGFDDVMIICRSKTLKDNNIKVTDKKCIIFVFSKVLKTKLKLRDAFDTVCKSGVDKNFNTVKNQSSVKQSPLAPMIKRSQVEEEIKKVIGNIQVDKPIENDVEMIKENKMIEHNSEVMKTLCDPDFINLMKIYQNKPELLLFAFNYLNSGSIVEMTEFDETDVKLSEYQKNVLKQVKELISQFDINIDDNMIILLIKRFKSNVSLIFRYLYQKHVCN